MKCTVNRLVATGRAITDARKLYESMVKMETEIKFFFVDGRDVGTVDDDIPLVLNGVPGTMNYTRW